MSGRLLIALMVAAALAAAIFLYLWPRDRDHAVTPTYENAGKPMPRGLRTPPEMADPASAATGRPRNVQRVVSTRLGHPPGLRLHDVTAGRYKGKVGVACGSATWHGQDEPVPFILAGRSLTTGSDARAIAARVEGCEDLRQSAAEP